MSTREERLAALRDATEEWADRRIEQYEDEAEFLRSVFSGRTNGGRLSDYVTGQASSLLENQINAFLVE